MAIQYTSSQDRYKNKRKYIISEIIKFYGYDKIKSLPITNDITNIDKSYYIKKNNEDKTVNFLLSHGFNEIITYTFVDKHIEKLITEEKNIINIKNPMSETNNVLRTSLLQGILKVFKLNVNKNNERIKLFEIGNIYEKKQEKINTKKQLICICEENDIINENKSYGCDINFFIIKKLVENIVTKIYKKKDIMFEKTHKNYLNENISANILIKDKKIGEIGLLENNFLEKMSIKNNVFFFQIDLNFKNKTNIKIKAISKFPKIKRDISIILNKDQSYLNLKIYMKSLKIDDLKNITFMNIFEVTKNTNSINIRLTFQNHNRTLTDNEINSRTFFIIEMLKKKYISNHDNKI
ncbi:MAG TPA: phenylalanine--tRNA ligase subunit beta-related protein [Candidatus Azoamicus sp.]